MVRLDGIADAQRLFGGVPQEGDRVGSADAPVSIQVFNDLQCSSCGTTSSTRSPLWSKTTFVPARSSCCCATTRIARNPSSSASSVPRRPPSRATAGSTSISSSAIRTRPNASASATIISNSLAGSIGELDVAEWREYLERESGDDGAIGMALEGYEELGRGLGIRTGQAAIVSGPNGTRTLQDAPTLAEIEAAIEAVR